MEGGRTTRQDFDEFEMLLGEIPKSLGNPHDILPTRVDISSGLETVPMEGKNKMISPSSNFTNLCHSSRSVKNGGNMTCFGGMTLPEISVDRKHQSNGKLDDVENYHETHALSGDGEESGLPDDKSLALAFEELSFKDIAASEQNNLSFSKYNETSPNNSSLNNPHAFFGMDAFEMHLPPLHQTTNGVSIDAQVNVNFPGYNGLELKKPKPTFSNGLANQNRSFPVCNGAMPLNPRGNAYQLIPTVPVPGIELTNSPYQQQFCLDAQALNFMPPHHLGQSNMTRSNPDGERYYRLQQHYLYQQPHQNHISEVIQFQKKMNYATQVQPFYEMPSDQNSYWNDNAVPSRFSRFDSSAIGNVIHQCAPQYPCGRVDGCEFSHGQQYFNTKKFLEHQVLDKVEKQYFPEKILTRSHGMNTLRYIRSNSFTTSQSTPLVHNRRQFSDDHGRDLLVRNNGSLKLDSQSSRSSSPDSLDSKHASKASQAKYSFVDEVIGRIYSLAKDQHGCRFLQRKFAEGSVEDANRIFVEIIDHIVELMTDPFGNYLIQKMLEVCTEDQRMQIIYAITREAGTLIVISCNMHGTRAVQKVIETLKSTEQIYMVVSSLKPGIVSLIKDINGNHVAQRCLQYFLPQQNEFLFDAVISHCVEIATDRQGCVVLQKCVHHSYGNQRNRLMSEISSYSLVLSQDPYGNYVVQYVLDEKVPWVIAAVLDQLEGNYVFLSMQKHSSNVVEKCLELAKEEDRVKIIRELMTSPRFLQILQDAYGNFVIQSALRECKGAPNAALVEAIKPHVPVLRSHPFGKKVLSSTSLKK